MPPSRPSAAAPGAPAGGGAGRPLRLAIVNDAEIIVAGLARMLAPYADRVQVVDLTAGQPGQRPRVPVDLVLHDTFGEPAPRPSESAARTGAGPRRVVYSWTDDPAAVRAAMDAGAAGYLTKTLPAAELVDALLAIGQGHRVVRGVIAADHPPGVSGQPDWPGRSAGLSGREAEVLALITRGMSNQEIADHTYLSINSVKTYIRTLYRKLGVNRRSQAVRWAMEHGFSALPAPQAD